MPKPDWTAAARRHIMARRAAGDYEAEVLWAHVGSDYYASLPHGDYDRTLDLMYEEACRAYCIHHGLVLEALLTRAPPNGEDNEPQAERSAS